MIFTGDLLFVNDVGRPDLRDADEDPSALAGKLYDSLHEKILTLPDEVKVYPAQDTKFGARHFRDLDRLAMVGETKWQHGMAVFCKPFTTATVRYFERDQIDKARAWLCET